MYIWWVKNGKISELKFTFFSFTYIHYMWVVRPHLHFDFSCRVCCQPERECCTNSPRHWKFCFRESWCSRSLSSDYGRPDKKAAVNALKSRFRKWLSPQGSFSSLKAILQYMYIDKWLKMVNFKFRFWNVKLRWIDQQHTSVGQRKIPTHQNQAYDLPKSVGVLYPLSNKNSWTAKFLVMLTPCHQILTWISLSAQCVLLLYTSCYNSFFQEISK